MPGCTFYTDEINASPEAHIVKETAGPHFVAGDVVLSAAMSADPDGASDVLVATWRARECDDVQGRSCGDQFALGETSVFAPFTLQVPGKKPVRVELVISDERGASDTDIVMIEVQNRAPELELQLQGYDVNGRYPVGGWLDVVAGSSDLDGDSVELEWKLFPPSGADANVYQWTPLTKVATPSYRLQPDIGGQWTVEVTATDSDGGSVVERIPILVSTDSAPCIATIEPAQAGATYIVDASEPPRRFALLSVTDDLDPYPLPSNAPEFLEGVQFRWFIATPDTAGRLIEIAGHDVEDYLLELDRFSPGDRIDVRAEVSDRIARTLPCASDAPTCSVSGDACLQRVSWGVEVR